MSLLSEAGAGSDRAWNELVELYQPLILGWLSRYDVAPQDAEELTQEVLSVLVKELPAFDHSGNTGAFRHWLRQVTVNRARGFWRSGKVRPIATGDTRFLKMVDQLEDDHSGLTERWNREHDRHVLQRLLVQIESEFSEVTLSAFRRLVFDNETAEQVAGELGLTVGATYSAKSRVLRKLRTSAEGLLDDAVFE
jgi:RNA polymerase sigma-70 factor (ECF subfamily)